MPTTPIDLITVSREYGAGGSELAARLGERLGWPVLDREIVARVAERLRLDHAAVERLDEHPPSLLSRIATMLLVHPAEAPSAPAATDVLSPDAVAEATRAVIVEAAESPPLVVVGHGGAAIFAVRPGTFHVRLVAPVEDRARRIVGRNQCAWAAAAEQARRLDADRARYLARYYQIDWRDPLRYDLVVNTGRTPIGDVADLIEQRIAVAAGR